VPARPPARVPQPVHERIAHDLRAAILGGKLKGGDRLPSEAELAREYNTQVLTVRKGLRGLVNEGLVTNRHRIGNFVTEHLKVQWDIALRDSDPTGHQEITVSTAEPGDLIGDRRLWDLLDFRGGGIAVRRSRLRKIDGIPVEIAHDYIPYEIAKDTALMRRSPVDAVQVLRECGYRVASAVCDEVCVRKPHPGESQALDVAPVHAVAELVRTRDFAPDQTCLLVGHSVYRTGPTIRFEFGH
jgi:GntR family transcriptional regulator